MRPIILAGVVAAIVASAMFNAVNPVAGMSVVQIIMKLAAIAVGVLIGIPIAIRIIELIDDRGRQPGLYAEEEE